MRNVDGSIGMSLTEFADKVGVHVSVACHWENGRSRPDLSRIPKIAEVLQVTPLQLVRGEKTWAVYQQALEAAA